MGERKEKNWKETERLWCIKPTVMELDTCTATAPSCHCLEVHQNAEKHKQPDIRWNSVEHYQIRWDNMVLWDVRASSSSRANLMNSGVSLKLADVDDRVCACASVLTLVAVSLEVSPGSTDTSARLVTDCSLCSLIVCSLSVWTLCNEHLKSP